jgi:prepilin-type N-terminal cleavage/methylation domain-containing protein
MNTHSSRHQGFSLVEMMVSMVAGLIVVGAGLAFTISSLRSNSELVQATRLNQELRASMDFIERELRRAAYDDASITYVLNPSTATPSPFAPIVVDGTYTVDATAGTATITGSSCIVYAYDRTGGTGGTVDLANAEVRAIRRVTRTVNGVSVGVVEFAESATGLTPSCSGGSPTYTTYPATCSSTSGWCALSDPRVVNIGSMSIGIVVRTVATGMAIRDIDVSMSGTLVGNANVLRGMQTSVAVRSPCMRTTVTDCRPSAW